jgi:hypothetical protein
MRIEKIAVLAIGMLVLNGCTNLNEGLSALNNGLKTINSTVSSGVPIVAPQRTDQTATQICAEAKNNNQRAVDLFSGKLATFEGKVKLSQGLSYQNVMYLYTTRGDQIALSNYPDTTSLNNGQTLKVNGVITGITTLYSCSISAKYSNQ